MICHLKQKEITIPHLISRAATEKPGVAEIHCPSVDVFPRQSNIKGLTGALPSAGHGSGAAAAELVDYALAREGQWYGTPRMSVHDAVAVAHLAIAELVTVAEYDVQVDTGDGPARGRTVCDGLPVRIARKGRAPNAQVGIQIDRDRFEEILVDAYGRLP